MPSSLFSKIVVCAVVIVFLGGMMSYVFSLRSDESWYAALEHPAGTPPRWVFGPVWTALYTLMGASIAFIWHDFPAEFGTSRLTFFFVLQLLLNLAWTPIYFGAQQIGIALITIILLWLAIVLTIREFFKYSRTAAWLLVPYFLWVTYATYLNAGYAWLN